jgi:FkbM family methyltransferase
MQALAGAAIRSGAIRPARRLLRASKSDLARGRWALKVDGSVMEVPPDMAWAFRDGSYYERNVEYWFRRLLEAIDDPAVYDIGANYGYYTLIAARNARTVQAFEPVTSTFQVLSHNLTRNGLHHAAAHKLAVGERAGPVRIQLYSSSGNNTVVERAADRTAHLDDRGFEDVQRITLDDFVGGGAPPPSLIKIDTEGSELEVLRGASGVLDSHAPVLLFEHDASLADDAGYSFGDVLGELGPHGYSVFALRDAFSRHGAHDRTLYPIDHVDLSETGTVVALPRGFRI